MPELASRIPAHSNVVTSPPAEDWQQALRGAYRDPKALLADLEIDASQIDWLADSPFAMRVPRGYVARMRRGDPQDPLLLQVLPRRLEQREVSGFVTAPLQEADYQKAPGLIQKYQGRALLITTGACAVHCRYCFRRNFDYPQAREGRDGWQAGLAAIRADSNISEVILSGGDPLSLADDKFFRLLDQLEAIPHLQRLRLHTRQPVVLPERITRTWLQRMQASRLRGVVVLHANHARELDHQVATVCEQMRQAGLSLLNQAVLLAGVNASADAQEALSLRLFECGVLPYYLHQLDPVAGAAHFELADEDARGIMRSLNARLPGYLVPRLVREIPGQPGKTPLHWTDLRP